MGNGGVLAEEEAAGARVGNTKVGFGKGGSRVEAWAAGQGDSMGHFVDGFEEKRRLRLRCCCCVRPGASGVPGGPVLVGGGAALGVLASGIALVAFLLVGTGGTVVPISSGTPSTRPAVACGVGTLISACVVGAPTAPTAATAAAAAAVISAPALLGVKLGLGGHDLVGKVGVGGGEGGVGGNQLLEYSFVVGSGAGKIVEGIVDGVKEAGGLVGVGMA